MDAVELPYPVDVAVVAPLCKLMGSDGFGRAAVGASVKEAEHRDFDSAVTLPSPSIGRFSSSNCDKGKISESSDPKIWTVKKCLGIGSYC